MKLNLCIIQFDRSAKDPEVNLKKMTEYLNEIDTNVDIAILPEDWLGPVLIDENSYLSVLKKLQSILPSENMLLLSGAQYVRHPGKAVSTGAFINKKDLVFYDKIFPSHAIGERNFIQPGSRLPLVHHRGIKVAAVVCVDMFYPEIIRNLALQGAGVIFNPANIPAGRMDLWQHIGITRAAENTVFTVMANNTMTGYPDGREVAGRSFVAGPDGAFFYDTGTGPGRHNIIIDLSLIDRARQRWRYLDDIRENAGIKKL